MVRSLAIASFVTLAAPAARAATVQDCTAAACIQDKSKYGFGAGYTVVSRTTDSAGTLGVDDRLTVRGELFGVTQSLAQVRAVGSNAPKSFEVDTYVWLPMLGKTQLTSDEADLAASPIYSLDGELSHTFYTIEERFYVVLKVAAHADGAAGYEAIGRVDSGHVNAFFEPYINASVRLTASVDVYVAEAGAYGRLYLVDATLPITTNIGTTTAGCASSYVKVDARLEELDGELGWFVRLFGHEKDESLYSWDGYMQSFAVQPGTTKPVCL